MIEILHEGAEATPAHLLSGRHDVIIVGASWDTRCRSIMFCTDVSTDTAVLISYRNKGWTGRSRESMRLLANYFDNGVAENLVVVDMESTDMTSTWASLRQVIVDAYVRVGRPLRIAIDLSSVPRYVSLGLLGLCVRAGCAGRMTYWYTAANEYEVEDENGEITDNYQFTVGRWLPQPIPALSRPTSGGKPMHLVVSAGIEGALTKRMVEDLEPAKLTMIYSVNRGNDLLVKSHEENRQLESAFLLPGADSVDLPLFKISSVVSKLRALISDDVTDHQGRLIEHSLLVSGAKPHALAFAVAACLYDVKNVFFGLAEARREVTGRDFGPYYRCDLRMTLVD